MNDMWLFVTRNNLESVVNPRDSTIDNVPLAVEILLRHFDSRGSVLDTARAIQLIALLSGATVRRGVEHIDEARVFWPQVLEQTAYPHQFATTLLSALWGNMTDINDVCGSKAWKLLKEWLVLDAGILCGFRDDVSIMCSLSEYMFGAHWYEVSGLGRPAHWEIFLRDISLQKPAFKAGIQRGPIGVAPLPLPDMDIGLFP